MELFDQLRTLGVVYEMHQTGLLVCALTEQHLEEHLAMFRELKTAGYDGEIELLDSRKLRLVEPALSDAVVGAIHAKNERHIKPETLIQGMATSLTEVGVEIQEQTAVRGLDRNGRAGWRVCTDHGDVDVDRVLLAAGVWTRELLRTLGKRIQLEAAKGYSVTATGNGTRPRHALYFSEAMVGCSPYVDAVRLAGVLELSGIEFSLNPRKIRSIEDAARMYLRDWQLDTERVPWAGLRPFAPDGLPIIGAVSGLEGLYIAAGHGMLGVTLGPATAAALAPLILSGRRTPELEPFRMDR